jgi:hypothetical protein
MGRELVGVVEQDGDGYVGNCYELGITCYGSTVDETFAKLREASWLYLNERAAGESRQVGEDLRAA